MPVTYNRRFIEREYIFSIERKNITYITDEQINIMLDALNFNWCDLTFKFTDRLYGWDTVIIDNDTNTKVELDELSGFALDYYMRQIEELSVEKAMRDLNKEHLVGVGA